MSTSESRDKICIHIYKRYDKEDVFKDTTSEEHTTSRLQLHCYCQVLKIVFARSASASWYKNSFQNPPKRNLKTSMWVQESPSYLLYIGPTYPSSPLSNRTNGGKVADGHRIHGLCREDVESGTVQAIESLEQP